MEAHGSAQEGSVIHLLIVLCVGSAEAKGGVSTARGRRNGQDFQKGVEAPGGRLNESLVGCG